MENLVTAIVWFGNTVVICIAAMVVYCMINRTDGSNKGGEQMVFIELAMWLIGLIVGFYTIAHLVMWIRGVWND